MGSGDSRVFVWAEQVERCEALLGTLGPALCSVGGAWTLLVEYRCWSVVAVVMSLMRWS